MIIGVIIGIIIFILLLIICYGINDSLDYGSSSHTSSYYRTSCKYYDLKCQERGYYIDSRGYYRFLDSDKLVHRQIAYKYVYLPNEDNYKWRFSAYDVHHKNRNKKDNRSSNLEVLTREEHDLRHRYSI